MLQLLEVLLRGDEIVTRLSFGEPKCMGICLPLDESMQVPIHWLTISSMVNPFHRKVPCSLY